MNVSLGSSFNLGSSLSSVFTSSIGFSELYKQVVPYDLSGLQLWLDSSDTTTLTVGYGAGAITETVSGTSGTKILTASATMARKAKAGMTIRLASTDVYTVASIEGDIINTVETLTTTYAALTSLEVSKFVSQQNDKSGNNNNGTQGTGSRQITSGIKKLGGKNITTFDASNDGLAVGADTTIDNIFSGGGTVIYVINPNITSGRTFDKATSAGTGWRLYHNDLSGNNIKLLFQQDTDGTGHGYQTSSRDITLGERNIVAMTYDSDSPEIYPKMYINSATEVAVARFGAVGSGNARDDSVNDLIVGNRSDYLRPFNGEIPEVIFINRVISDSERNLLFNYLSNKWTLNLADLINNKAVLDLNAAIAESLTSSSNKLSQWDDQTDFAHSIAQATGSLQPVTGLTTENGLNVIDFDGTDDYLQRSDALGFTGSAGGTILVAAKPTKTAGASSSEAVLALGNSSGTAGKVRSLDMEKSATQAGIRFNDGNRLFVSPFDGSFVVATWEWADGADYGSHELYVNGTIQTQSSSTNSTYVPNLDDQLCNIGKEIGGSGSYFGGSVGRIIVFDEDLTAIERSVAETGLNILYGAY